MGGVSEPKVSMTMREDRSPSGQLTIIRTTVVETEKGNADMRPIILYMNLCADFSRCLYAALDSIVQR